MQTTKKHRLAQLERRLAADTEQVAEHWQQVAWERFTADRTEEEIEAILTSIERWQQPGYAPSPEDRALDQRWEEAVRAVLPEPERRALSRREWALAWCKGIRQHD